MHQYQFDSRRRKVTSEKHPNSLSRREVSFEPQKKRKKERKEKHSHSHSHSSSSRSSSVSILTSSRPSSGVKEVSRPASSVNEFSKSFKAIEPSKFYEDQKSLLEKQYERNLQKFVPIEMNDNFSPLESDPVAVIDPEVNIEENLLCKAKGVDEPSLIEDSRPEASVSDLVSDSALEKEFHVTYYIHASDELLKKAHSLVLGANDISGARVYYSLVKMALKALHIVICDYRVYLNPVLESVLYHKLGTIYVRETQEWEMAEQYVNLSISLAKKHDLTRITIMSEFLYCQVLEHINPQALSAFLLEKHKFYKEKGHAHIADMFLVIRTNQLPLTDGPSCMKTANTSSLSKNALPHIKSLFLLCEASVQLYRGLSTEVEESIETALALINDTEASPQMIALANLTKLSFCVQMGDHKSGRPVVEKLGNIISVQRENNWKGWRDDGYFEMTVPLRDGGQETATFDFRWVNSDEFIILFYFLSALLDILDATLFDKTKKIFVFCLEIINMQLEQLTNVHANNHNFHISYLTDKIVRLSFIRYSVIYYKTWIAFLHESDYGGISSVKYFIDCFDEDNFTKEEMCFYKLLVPKFLYLAAIYYQAHGDLNAAKYYFSRVRIASSNASTDQNAASSLQKTLGVGCQMLTPKSENNELYVFSTVHLAVIANHDLAVMAKTELSETGKSKYLMCHSFLSDLISDLSLIFEENSSGQLNHPKLAQQVYRLVRFACLTREVQSIKSARVTDASSIFSDLAADELPHGFVKVLHSYMLYKFSTSLDESSKMLQHVVSSMNGSDKAITALGVLLMSDGDAFSIEHNSLLQELKKVILPAKDEVERKIEVARKSAHI